MTTPTSLTNKPSGIPQTVVFSVTRCVSGTANFVKKYAFTPTVHLISTSVKTINARVINPLAIGAKKVASSISSIDFENQKIKKPAAIIAATLLTAGLLYGMSQNVSKSAIPVLEKVGENAQNLEEVSGNGFFVKTATSAAISLAIIGVGAYVKRFL